MLIRNRQLRVHLAQSAIHMLVAARILLSTISGDMEIQGKDEDGTNFASLPEELKELVVLHVGGSTLTREERKRILSYARERENLTNRQKNRASFLAMVIKRITFWPEDGSVLPPCPDWTKIEGVQI